VTLAVYLWPPTDFNDSDFAMTAAKVLAEPVTHAALDLVILARVANLGIALALDASSDPKPNGLHRALPAIAPNPDRRESGHFKKGPGIAGLGYRATELGSGGLPEVQVWRAVILSRGYRPP
jgi:hypothetical protein